jgi:hypothetical protein
MLMLAGLACSLILHRALIVILGSERLDKELMIGSMQGKYQTVMLPDVGHSIHENIPEKVAEALFEFCRRNQRLVLPPKVVGISPTIKESPQLHFEPQLTESFQL